MIHIVGCENQNELQNLKGWGPVQCRVVIEMALQLVLTHLVFSRPNPCV
jgi:hypothetical protein